MNTKERILAAAQELFNEYGYNKVSMRMIADQLNMSVGNLTYHFPKKIDLVNQLLKNERISEKNEVCTSLSNLNDRITNMLVNLVGNKYFFVSERGISSQEEFIQSHAKNIEILRNNLSSSLFDLKEAGYFENNIQEAHIDAIVDMIMYSHIAWIENTKNHYFLHQLSIEEFINKQWLMIQPCLSEKGLIEYQELFN